MSSIKTCRFCFLLLPLLFAFSGCSTSAFESAQNQDDATLSLQNNGDFYLKLSAQQGAHNGSIHLTLSSNFALYNGSFQIKGLLATKEPALDETISAAEFTQEADWIVDTTTHEHNLSVILSPGKTYCFAARYGRAIFSNTICLQSADYLEKKLGFAPNAMDAKVTTLFSKPEQWQQTLNNIHAFKYYVNAIPEIEAEALAEQVAQLNAHQIDIAIEAGCLRDFVCKSNQDPHAYLKMKELELPAYQALVAAGAKKLILTCDGPFVKTLASGASLAHGCQFDIPDAAQQLALYMKSVETSLPETSITWKHIEPTPLYSFQNPCDDALDDMSISFNGEPTLVPKPEPITDCTYYPATPEVKETSVFHKVGNLHDVLKATRETTQNYGVSFTSFHSDSSASTIVSPTTLGLYDGFAKMNAIEDYVVSLGMRFGMLLNYSKGSCQSCPGASNEEFFNYTSAIYDCLQTLPSTQMFTQVQDLMVQSWWQSPGKLIPENEDYTFTNLMLHFNDKLTNPDNLPQCSVLD